ncbi:mate-domain-containing protein [Gongronella butleri]|nr:mate-domain-containing protein [Gongronella butleri]
MHFQRDKKEANALATERTPLCMTPSSSSSTLQTMAMPFLDAKDPYQNVLTSHDFYAMVRETHIVAETKALAKYAWPLLITFLVGMGNRIVDMRFIGRMGPQVLAANGLAMLFITVCGIAMGNGLMTAIDTLVSQAFTGAHQKRTLGIILQRSILIVGAYCVPVAIAWIYAKDIMIWMGQDAELAAMAHRYIVLLLPVLYPMLLSTAFRRYLQAVNRMRVTMVMIFLVFPANYALDWLFLEHMDLGIVGIGVENIAYQTLLFCMFLVYLRFMYPGVVGDASERVWPGWQWREATSQWGTFLRLAVPGMLSVSTDWAFEVCALVTGVLGEISLAAQSIVLTVNTFLLMIPFALATALAVRLGHHLGANEPGKAKQCVMIAVFFGFCFTSLNAMILFGYRYPIAIHFTTNEMVVDAVAELLHVVSPCHFLVGNGVMLSAVLNAFGKQYIVASVNLGSYYLIGLPFGIWLTFWHNYGLAGVWYGVMLAAAIKIVCEVYILVFRTDWQKECLVAMKRVRQQETLPL